MKPATYRCPAVPHAFTGACPARHGSKLLLYPPAKHPPHPPAMNTGLSPDEQFELGAPACDAPCWVFDTVQILVSNSHGGGHGECVSGCGRWLTRQGMAHDFITRDRARLSGGDRQSHTQGNRGLKALARKRFQVLGCGHPMNEPAIDCPPDHRLVNRKVLLLPHKCIPKMRP